MLGFVLVSLFFVKQKTAYEMRISDWSSDVCSSDLTRSSLGGFGGLVRPVRRRQARTRILVRHGSGTTLVRRIGGVALRQTRPLASSASISASSSSSAVLRVSRRPTEACAASVGASKVEDERRSCSWLKRSEEHTSELQS